MIYGANRKLRVVRWTVARMAGWSIQDTSIKNLWCREGPPTDAILVDVVLQKNTVLGASSVSLVLEHPSFDPVPPGTVIPEQPVVYLDVTKTMAYVNTRLDAPDGGLDSTAQ